jgi:hypothetical protein
VALLIEILKAAGSSRSRIARVRRAAPLTESLKLASLQVRMKQLA